MYDVVTSRDARIPSGVADVTLSADVVLPDADDQWPVLVTVLPYRNDAGGGLMMASELEWFAAQGYVCVLVDPRGIGGSDGQQRAPFDPDEADDGVAAVNWAATQPWCNGAVGMWGHSYGALMALRTATRHPKALRAILPVMAPVDPELDFVHPQGIRGGLGPGPTWGMATLVNQLLPPLRDDDDPAQQRRWQDRLEAEPWLLDLLRHPPGDAIWRERAVDVSLVDVPTYCIAGWRDLFCDATIRAYEQITAPKKLLVGPWMHTVPHVAPDAAIDFRGEALRWWDHWLKGTDTGVMDEPVTVFVDGAHRGWRRLQDWPSRNESVRLTPCAGRLATGGVDVPEPVALTADPTVGAQSGLTRMPSGFGLPLDQHDDDMRSAHITSLPLDDALLVTGRPSVQVQCAAGAPHLVARLCDVDADGRSLLITMGAAVVGAVGGAQDGRVEVALAPTAYRVAAGHRLRLVIGHADVPTLWPAAAGAGDSLQVSGMSITLPVLAEDDAEPVDLPPPPATEPPILVQLLRYGGGGWTISRDHVNQVLEIRTTEDAETVTLDGAHTLALATTRAIRVPQWAPESTYAESLATAAAKREDCGPVTIRAQVRVTAHEATVEATITQGSDVILNRIWTTPLP
jgi:uncharacterized protein